MRILFTIFIICFAFILRAQNREFNIENIPDKSLLKSALKELKIADKYYEAGGFSNYYKALTHYRNAYKVNPDNIDLNQKFGDCYLNTYDKERAFIYLKKARELEGMDSPKTSVLFGRAYQMNLKPDSAIAEYSKYIKMISDTASKSTINAVEKWIEECEYLKELMANPIRVNIENMGKTVNSRFSEYCPIISADESVMIFTSRRSNTTGGEIDPDSDDYYEDLYITTQDEGVWSLPRNMGEIVNTEYHDATVNLSPDGQELLIYNDFEGDGNIYRCELVGSQWSMPERLNDNINSPYHEPSACFSFDGRTLYFVSNKPGGLGGKDIYVSRKDKNDEWGPATNLGPPVNTSGDEDAVFLHPDGTTLYFSSNGHKTIGGYDIFKSVMTDGKWGIPENIGYPINTPGNDVFFVISASGEHGYYSSAQKDSHGKLDLYRITFIKDSEKVEEEPKLTLLRGIINEEISYHPIEARIEIVDNTLNQVVAVFKSNKTTGKYLISLPSGRNYGLNVSADNYLFHSENFDIKDTVGYQEVEKNIALKKLEVGKSIVLKNIFFEFDKDVLKPESVAELEKLKKLMNDFPAIQIEISGHTDSKGNDDYNLNLSQDRATAVVEYLIEHGIQSNRLIARGAGENFPIAPNENPDGSDNPEGRALNRRTEFKIISK